MQFFIATPLPGVAYVVKQISPSFFQASVRSELGEELLHHTGLKLEEAFAHVARHAIAAEKTAQWALNFFKAVR